MKDLQESIRRPRELFALFDARAMSLQFAAGSLLFRTGDPVTGIYTVRTGRIALIWTDTNKVQPMDTVGPGDVIGLPAALNGEYSVGGRVVADSELGFVPAHVVASMLHTDPHLLHLVTQLLAAEVVRMRSLVSEARSAKKSVRPVQASSKGGG